MTERDELLANCAVILDDEKDEKEAQRETDRRPKNAQAKTDDTVRDCSSRRRKDRIQSISTSNEKQSKQGAPVATERQYEIGDGDVQMSKRREKHNKPGSLADELESELEKVICSEYENDEAHEKGKEAMLKD